MPVSRADIAAALNDAAIPGVYAAPSRPDTVVAGAAWPVWVETVVQNGCVDQDNWQVIVLLPAGHEDAAIDVLDTIRGQVKQALYKVGAVTRLAPESVVIGDGTQDMPALMCELATA